MAPEDKTEFMQLLGELFGAYDKRATAETLGGYWETLKSMAVGDFRHVIEVSYERLRVASVTRDGVIRMPTAGALWGYHRERLAAQKAAGRREDEAPAWYGDEWNIAANTLLLHYVTNQDWRGRDTDRESRELYRRSLTWADTMRESRRTGQAIDGKSLWQTVVVGLTTQAPF